MVTSFITEACLPLKPNILYCLRPPLFLTWINNEYSVTDFLICKTKRVWECKLMILHLLSAATSKVSYVWSGEHYKCLILEGSIMLTEDVWSSLVRFVWNVFWLNISISSIFLFHLQITINNSLRFPLFQGLFLVLSLVFLSFLGTE